MESFQRPELKQRSPEFKAADMTALQALAQAAINVELFTIPLYMISLFSIQGMHQITSSGNDFYQGRLWPGAAPFPDPEIDPDNQTNALAFNHFFSVFIDEMLHLQLASNVAKALGVMPTYNSSALQDTNYGWTCYGPNKTVIPHILDFRDTIKGYNDIKVKLDALTLDQNRLFLAIEENEDDAKSIIDPQKIGNYFPSVPFVNWSADNTETDLPLFGTIGWMYKCLWQYMEIVYTDGTSLFESVFNRGTLERDLFNARSSYHQPEYPKMPTMASGEISVPDAMENILNMINAITDQGEGSGVAEWIRRMRGQLQYAPVKEQFQPDETALNFDYPNYTDTGAQDNPSGDTVARSNNGGLDHHDRFLAINELLKTGKIVTWDQWHASGNSWTAEMLKTSSYDQNKWPLPPAEDVAAALNNLKGDASNYDIFSQVATGSIAGITRVLSGFWTDEKTSFPSPSMYGSGDRVSICWAIFGQYPDISKGIVDKTGGTLYHACQALDLDNPGNSCAPVAVFHSCRGSNDCKAEGGCGFVQLVGEDKIICGTKVLKDNLKPTHPLQKILKLYSAPSDNTCAGFGGCAIPISASQLYPAPDSADPKQEGTMEVFDLEPATPVKLGTLSYSLGDKVYDVAWNAYIEVLKSHKVSPLPEKPKVDSDLRLAFPPST
jgi:Ferritin-like